MNWRRIVAAPESMQCDPLSSTTILYCMLLLWNKFVCGKDSRSRKRVTHAGWRRRVIDRVLARHAAAVQDKSCEL